MPERSVLDETVANGHPREPFTQTAEEIASTARRSVSAVSRWGFVATAGIVQWVAGLMPNWHVMRARSAYWAFVTGKYLLFGFVYVTMIAAGMQMISSLAAMKLYKSPGLGFLKHYEVGYRLTVAHPLSVVVLLASFYIAEKAVLLWLRPGESPDKWFDADNYRRVVTVLAVMVIGGDAVCYYLAVSEANWGGSAVSFVALVATLLYTGMMAAAAICSVNLKAAIRDAKTA